MTAEEMCSHLLGEINRLEAKLDAVLTLLDQEESAAYQHSRSRSANVQSRRIREALRQAVAR